MSTEDEIITQQREILRQVRSDAELMTQLMAHKGWPRYLALIEAVGQNYYKAAVAPLTTMDSALPAEYAKGALNGLTLAATLPQSKINEAKELNPRSDEEA